MKKFLLLVLIAALMLSVSATSTVHFSRYDPTYTIEAASKAWALYLSDELRETGRDMGKNILIGNFYDNPKIRKIWALPPDKSKEFGILQMDGYTVITGDENTLPQLTRLFEGEYNPNSPTFFMFLTLSIFTFLFFLYILRDAPYASSLYSLSVLTLTLWIINGYPGFRFEDGFFRGVFYEALKLNFTGISREPLSYLIFAWGKAFGFTLFSMHLLHFYLLFLIISLLFYLPPKHSRELGFLIFGLTFSLPLFREHIKTLSGDLFALLFFELLLVIGTNFSFAPNSGFEVLAFGALTSASMLLMPASFVIPVSFIAVYPKRFKRNYIYLLSVLVLYAFLSAFFKVDIRNYFTIRGDFTILRSFAREGILQFALLAYSCGELKKNRKKRIIGQTWFVGLASLLYTVIFVFVEVSELPLFLLLSTFAIRLSQKASQT